MQHWEKTRNYFISIQPKTFHMLYKHNDLSISVSLYQLYVELELNEHRNPSKMLLETCTTQSFKYSTIYIYIYTEYTMETFESIFFKNTEMCQNKCFLIFKYSILTCAAPISFARLGTALNYLPLMV